MSHCNALVLTSQTYKSHHGHQNSPKEEKSYWTFNNHCLPFLALWASIFPATKYPCPPILDWWFEQKWTWCSKWPFIYPITHSKQNDKFCLYVGFSAILPSPWHHPTIFMLNITSGNVPLHILSSSPIAAWAISIEFKFRSARLPDGFQQKWYLQGQQSCPTGWCNMSCLC